MLTVYHSNMFTPQVGRVWRAPVVLEIFALGNFIAGQGRRINPDVVLIFHTPGLFFLENMFF